ncbi:hypothetical protein KR51_00009150 [Rubidibacter lacunae KORDI 51-2]|uniref:SH3b domain-containing protein n=1 Tax=Rubidibacter lacunae KORDI 51-2 TaxID=582515 RepID=U5DP55_9CHRO|nr:SH3 domain-containing protein [Rubidibacter lacunae]ERN42394.1 hypothetical protein KR51_00009150 [Rubidibacter lacunae KORDI 51-2]
MNWVGLIQLILGFIFGIALFVGAGVGAGYYFLSRLADAPPPPTFPPPEEQPAVSEPTEPEEPTTEFAETTGAAEPELEPKTPTFEERFGPSAYRAFVTWPEGLRLRSEPGDGGEAIGGVAFDQELVILGTSDDGVWQRVHVQATGEEAWVKAGNVRRADEPATTP